MRLRLLIFKELGSHLTSTKGSFGFHHRSLPPLPWPLRNDGDRFLPDLKSLDLALGFKPETNPFLWCRSVNKGLVKAAQKSAGSSKTGRGDSGRKSPTNQDQRQELVTVLMKLDDEELTELWMIHLRNKRRNPSNVHSLLLRNEVV
jgi:hypothetical protein